MGKKQFNHILGYRYRKGKEFTKVTDIEREENSPKWLCWAAGQWFEGNQVGLNRQPVVTASLPAFPSDCFGKTTGGTPIVPVPWHYGAEK